jgi:hypothetical protein
MDRAIQFALDSMTIIEAVQNLDSLDSEGTIYAARPWAANSIAVVDSEPEGGGIRHDAKEKGLDYFLEVIIAREILEDLEAYLERAPTSEERCERIIQYATYDA